MWFSRAKLCEHEDEEVGVEVGENNPVFSCFSELHPMEGVPCTPQQRKLQVNKLSGR